MNKYTLIIRIYRIIIYFIFNLFLSLDYYLLYLNEINKQKILIY